MNVRRGAVKRLTKTQTKEIHALQRMKNEAIDLTDIPQSGNWDKAVVGKFDRQVRNS